MNRRQTPPAWPHSRGETQHSGPNAPRCTIAGHHTRLGGALPLHQRISLLPSGTISVCPQHTGEAVKASPVSNDDRVSLVLLTPRLFLTKIDTIQMSALQDVTNSRPS